jgi:hypothetical protein
MKQYYYYYTYGGANLSDKKIKCFLSYAHVDKEFVLRTILPLLEKNNLNVWLDTNKIDFDDSIINQVIKGIRDADIVISILNMRSTYVNLELGAAIGINKPILALVNDEYWSETPNDLKSIHILRYNKNQLDTLQEKLESQIRNITEQVIDKSTFQQFSQNKENKIIGLSVGTDLDDFELELKFTIDFIQFVKDNTNDAEITLIQPSKGSLKNLVKIDFKSWAELLEKLIFIIPELKKRKTDRMKVEAEIGKINAETRDINIGTNIKQAQAFADLMEKYQKLGIKIQIDDDLLITQNSEGLLTFKEPKKLE